MAQTDQTGEHIVRGACHHDCPDTCAWEVTVAGGRAVRLRGDPDHPTTRGELCPKVSRFIDRAYSPDRLTTPLRRTGPKGAAEFEPVGWDTAIAEIAMQMSAVADRFGPAAILPYSLAGTQGLLQMGVMADRFFGELGSSQIHRHLCGVSAWLGAASVYGTPYSIDPEDLAHAKTILLWGTNTRLTNRHLWPTLERAQADGASVIVVDPIRTATADAADQFVQLRPGTDVALVLGMLRVIRDEGLLDHEWIETRTEGWAELSRSIDAFPVADAAAVTGVDATRIADLARRFVTDTPAAVRVLIGPEHREYGREIMQAVAMLPAVTGGWRQRGGGLARSTAAYFDESLSVEPTAGPPRAFNMASLGAVLNDNSLDPPITALFIHNCNPVTICPDANAVVRGLEREDLFTVVAEQFMTDTARYADFVLPVTTQLEHLDLVPAWGHLYLSLNQPAIDPVGDALPNSEIFRRLAAAMGMSNPELTESDQALARGILDSDHPWMQGVTWERLLADGWVRLAVPDGQRPFVDQPPDTTGGWIRLGALTHRDAQESPDGNAELARRLPLTLMSRKQHVRFLNSSYAGAAAHLPSEGEPLLEMHESDATARGVDDGDRVLVYNDRGRLEITVTVSDAVQPGLVAMPFGWWRRDAANDTNVNALTNPSVASDQLGSPAFHETQVEVTLLP